MNLQHIIVQAGGKGSRMGHLTHNKPKALVPVENLPMLFHLFKRFPKAKFIIIGDYKFGVLERYLKAFAAVDYELVNAGDKKGTCSGVDAALEHIPEQVPFMLVWSDLVLPSGFELPCTGGDYVGVARDFPCRWSFKNGCFIEKPSETCGVAGMFIFSGKAQLFGVPEEGEFVRWLSGRGLEFSELPLHGVKEYGLLAEYEELPRFKCRPFNRIVVEGDTVVKEGIDEQGRALAVRERAWYRQVQNHEFGNIPRIYSLEPLRMERIQGKNVYEYTGLPYEKKSEILSSLITCLKQVHALGSVQADTPSFEDAYIGKTFARLGKIQALIPFADQRVITVNGKKCRNVYFHREELARRMRRYMPASFSFLHGDCTFSNMMLKNESTPVLIDPRGYFGHTELYGDTTYDWAKLYYSIAGNYDRFNLKQFRLDIREADVELAIESNGWEDMEPLFFKLLEGEAEPGQIKLIHAIIWLSLTTYAWEDYDSICGAFYNGLWYLEDVL